MDDATPFAGAAGFTEAEGAIGWAEQAVTSGLGQGAAALD
jgi:hypothetical protein